MTDALQVEPQFEFVRESKVIAPLASRWQRLFASLLDTLTILVVTLPAMYFTGGLEGLAEGVKPSFGYSLAMGVLGIVVFFALNGKLLANHGQTVGKKVVGIKIVDVNGNLATFKDHLLKRYATYFLPGQIPIVGQIFGILNVLLIFGKQKRCAHDHFAGTIVVLS